MGPAPSGAAPSGVATLIPSNTKTAPSGGVVPPPVRDLAVLCEDIRAIRYCPLAEVDARVMRIALRLANAEGMAWELRNGGGQ